VPPLPEEKSAEPKTSSSEYEIPLYGNTSIAKSLEIKTDISSRLSNMIAISANSEGKQGEMGTDATPFGHINKNFTDRYIPLRTDIVDEKQKTTKNTDGDSDAAIKFNDAIKQYYGYIDVSLDSVNGATNYYIARMAKTKSENPATRASAIIPVSLNFTTDGISGFNMYQSFGINEELLPYTYTAKNKLDDVPVDRRVGFCVVGLTHNIENNQWNTSVRANMIFLKSSEDYKGEKLEKYPSNTQGKIRNPEIFSGRSPILGGGNTLNVTSIKGGNKARLSAIINMPGSWIDKTVAFFKWREGFISAPANDEGTLRLGYGSDKIYRNGKLFDVTSDSRTTESEALQTLLYEIQYTSYYTAMTSDLGKSNWDKLNDNQKAALMSMSYNCGAYFVRKNYGRAIKDAITNSDYERAAQIIANGSPNRGKITGVSLNERRALEAALFLSRP
jgi:GH24 family phage-related lysozyme (muramidase)